MIINKKGEVMKIKIISDGTSIGTKLINAETNEIIEDCRGAHWICDVDDNQLATAILEFVHVPVEIIGEMVIKKPEWTEE
jgi:hypothetical protein